jgi:hypothetical protein
MKKCVIENEEVLLSVLDTAGQDDCRLLVSANMYSPQLIS